MSLLSWKFFLLSWKFFLTLVLSLKKLWNSSSLSDAVIKSWLESEREKYEIEELVSKYQFQGHTGLTVEQALAVKQELEQIDELLKQLEEAREPAQIAVIDMEALSEFTEPDDLAQLEALRQMV